METENALRIAEYLCVPFVTLEETCKKARSTGGISLLDLIELGAEPSDFAHCLKVGNDVYEPVFWLMSGEYLDQCKLTQTKVPVLYTKRGEVVQGLDVF